MNDILFFDLETTGFSQNTDGIIEIAACVVDPVTLKVKDTFNTFVNPGITISEKITQITSITNDDVRHAPTEEMAFNSFKDFVSKYTIGTYAGHNIDAFDMKWMHSRNERFNLGLNLDVETIDTLKVVKDIAKTGALKGYNFTTKTGRASFKLEYLMAYFNLGEQNHRAIDDVKNNIIVYKNLKELERKNTSLGF